MDAALARPVDSSAVVVAAPPRKPRLQVPAIIGGWIVAQSLSGTVMIWLAVVALLLEILTGRWVGLSILGAAWFSWCLTYAGDVFGGMFTAAMARNYRLRHVAWTGGLMGLLAPVWKILGTGTFFLRIYAQNPRLTWPGASYFVSQVDRASLLSMLLHPLAVLAGGLLQVGIMRRDESRRARLTWQYQTAAGRLVTAQTPWHHAGLARFWKAAGWLFFATCFLPLIPAILMARVSIWAGISVLIGLGIAVVQTAIIGLACRALWRKHRAESVGDLLARDSRPPVLYLRSFLDDGRGRDISVWRQLTDALSSLTNKTFEQRLARYAESLGPFVAIGRPGEELPEAGAARMYVSNEDWQSVATDLMARSQLVLLQVGETRGLQWELDQVDNVRKPGEVILFTPFGLLRDARRKEREYAAFREWATTCIPGEFPAAIGKASFLYFEPGPGWTARALTYKGDVAVAHPRAELLRKFAVDKAFRPEPLISLLGWLIIVPLVLAILFLIVILLLPMFLH